MLLSGTRKASSTGEVAPGASLPSRGQTLDVRVNGGAVRRGKTGQCYRMYIEAECRVHRNVNGVGGCRDDGKWTGLDQPRFSSWGSSIENFPGSRSSKRYFGTCPEVPSLPGRVPVECPSNSTAPYAINHHRPLATYSPSSSWVSILRLLRSLPLSTSYLCIHGAHHVDSQRSLVLTMQRPGG